MTFDRTGIILYTLNYEACLAFYRDLLELRPLFQNTDLTCFAFGDAYLMVERDDEAPTPEGRLKTCLRMHVKNVRAAADQLEAKGIVVDYQEHAWGTVAKFFDPDGNLCALKDTEKFEQQVLDGLGTSNE